MATTIRRKPRAPVNSTQTIAPKRFANQAAGLLKPGGWFAACITLAVLLCGSAIGKDVGVVPGRLLAKPNPHFLPDQTARVLKECGAEEKETLTGSGVKVLRVPALSQRAILDELKRRSAFEFVEEDRLLTPDLIPNDPSYAYEWHLPKIEAPAAWDVSTGTKDVIIAILDTGVDATHPDLSDKPVAGWNVYDNNTNTADVAGQGTAVAGIAAASSNNGLGIASVAWNCLIQPVRISDTNGLASTSDIAQGLTWAADHGARVANISYAVSTSSTVRSAAQYFQSKGGVVTVSAGNDGTVATAADNPYVLTVSATDENDLVPSWSTTGSNVDLSAPGTNIRNTTRGGGYGSATGTSASAPIVAAVAALIFSINPNLSGDQVQTILKQSADDLGPVGWDPRYGWGRVNARKALQLANAAGPDVIAPTVSISSPANASTVSGTLLIAASANDNVGVTRLELYVDSQLMTNSATGSIAYSWDTKSSINGQHQVRAQAYDTAENMGTTSVSVQVENPVPDTSPPTVQIIAPLGDSIAFGIVTVTARASDNVGVSKVEFLVNGNLASISTNDPYTFAWDTTQLPNGTVNLQATAYDSSGNTGSSTIISVRMQNPVPDTTPPSVQITSPAAKVVVAGSVSVNVAASDDVGVTKINWYLNGNLMESSTTVPAAFTWKTRNYAAGAYQIQAQAFDAAGNRGASPSVTVFIASGDETAPTMEITSPASGSTVAGTVSVTVSGADNVGVSKVEWYLDGTLKGSSQQASPVFSWDTLGIPDGSHTLQARAYDAAGNSAFSAQVPTTVYNPVVDTTAPVVAIANPTSGATFSSFASVSVNAVDDTGITRLELYADGHLIDSTTNAPAAFRWLPKGLNSSHTLQAIAYDAAGNEGFSSPVIVYPEALAHPLMTD